MSTSNPAAIAAAPRRAVRRPALRLALGLLAGLLLPPLTAAPVLAQANPAASLLPNAPGTNALPNLLPSDIATSRQGSTTAAEGGPSVAGPLGEQQRAAGPATAVFGATLFTRSAASSTTAPNPNYAIMPGDSVSVRVWGAVDAEAVGNVDAQGNLFLPSIGPIRLAGTRAGDLQRVVEEQVRRIYTQQVQVYAVLLTANQIGVFVTGFVKVPGRHLGAGADSVLDFIARAGGIDPARGSYRDVTVERGGRAVARIDMYNFLLRGQLPSLQLQSGDTIVVARQRALVGADGAVRNNFLFEVPSAGRVMQGRELLELAGPLPAATNAVIRGSRNGQPWSRYVTTRELAGLPLQDQDIVTFITDSPAPTVRVSIEGSRLGPSVLIADRDTGLCNLLDYVAVDPTLANTGSVFLLRPGLALQQKRTIDEALDRLERQLFTAVSSTDSVAQIRTQEANLVAQYIGRMRRVQPEGRLVVTDRNGRCSNVRLMEGDVIVIPERADTVLVAGEVVMPGAVLWKPNLTVSDYIKGVGGFTQRGDMDDVVIRRANGEVEIRPTTGPAPGDEVIAMPHFDPKIFQAVKDVVGLLFQSALSARVFMD